MNIFEIARICHEANRALCLSHGDESQPSWSEAPGWQKDSAVNGVIFHLSGDHPPSASHENWMAEKRAAGWVYGPKKNPEAKEHPCMVPFSDLPPEQQAKDHLFVAIVRAMAPYAPDLAGSEAA